MDLAIAGRTALVCASSKGLGRACALSLARESVTVTMVARCEQALQAAAAEIRQETGARILTVAADITTPEGRAAALAVCGAPDILITNAGGPKPGDFRQGEREHWIAALDANMFTPIALIKATLDAMIERRFGRIVNITSAAVKAPIDILGLSNGARSGLTGFVAGLARKTVAHNVTINNLLSGPFETNRLRETARPVGHPKRQESGRRTGRAPSPQSVGTLWLASRIRRCLRLLVQCAGGFYHWSEPAA